MSRVFSRSDCIAGVREMTPLLLGLLPFGLVCGVGAQAAGASAFAAAGMSALMFSGAAQILGSLPIAIILLLFIIASAWHMKIGMQVVIEDYIHSEGAKVVALMANTFFAIAVGATCILAVLKLGFGG